MQKDLTEVIKFLDKSTRQIDETWVIKYKNVPIKLRSGKSAWRTAAHAKSAFTNHLYDAIPYEVRKQLGFSSNKELSAYLFEQGIVKVQLVD